MEEWVAGGGAYVAIHAGGSSFACRPGYNRIIGLAWRDADGGDRITLDAAGNVMRTPQGEGPGSGHGPCFAYPVCHQQPEHPVVLSGLPHVWMHEKD